LPAGPRERTGLEGLGLPDRSGQMAPVVDVLPRAATLWERGDRDGLARFLAEGARGREDQVRLVAHGSPDPGQHPARRRRAPPAGGLPGRAGYPARGGEAGAVAIAVENLA